MPTPSERRALIFLGAVACLGSGVRVMRARDLPQPTASERRALDAQIGAVDSTRKARRKPKAGRGGGRVPRDTGQRAPRIGVEPAITVRPAPRPPRIVPGSGIRIDVDRATADELVALPGVGPSLARRIVADRDSNGPFGSLQALGQVRGIGPATLQRLDSLVSFSGTPRPVSDGKAKRSRTRDSAHTRGTRAPP